MIETIGGLIAELERWHRLGDAGMVDESPEDLNALADAAANVVRDADHALGIRRQREAEADGS